MHLLRKIVAIALPVIAVWLVFHWRREDSSAVESASGREAISTVPRSSRSVPRTRPSVAAVEQAAGLSVKEEELQNVRFTLRGAVGRPGENPIFTERREKLREMIDLILEPLQMSPDQESRFFELLFEFQRAYEKAYDAIEIDYDDALAASGVPIEERLELTALRVRKLDESLGSQFEARLRGLLSEEQLRSLRGTISAPGALVAHFVHSDLIVAEEVETP